jgi:capsular exopolysaccharide synthesis family protein
MTRLSEALKKAAAETAAEPAKEPVRSAEAFEGLEGGPSWQFAPVETMHVPDEPALDVPEEPVSIGPPSRPSGIAEATAATSAATAERTVSEPMAVKPIHVGDSDRTKLVIDERVDPNVVEQYRHLAAVLHHAQKATGVRAVMVTSALPSEGKTLTATNLALTLSQSYQRRVLLIDADLRRPRMREMFGLPDTEGLTDSLVTPRRDRLPVHQITPTLWVLTSGHVLPDPMSLLVSPAMKQLIDDARESFDWVVVDTPPIAILPDANLLSAMIDTALLVVSAQSTPYPMVQRAAQAIGPSRILGVVLNRAENSGPASYNYSGYRTYRQASPGPEPRRWFHRFRKSASQASHVQ